ncbi:MAG: hypothetical protein HY356_06450 [Gammaproteobacteria bacterium]|nr:hypothetical protein [Gammaproteobacteria bacterium]
MGVKYLNLHYAPKTFDKNAIIPEQALARIKHIGSNFVPIFVQQLYEQGAQGIAGFFGHPIYETKKEDRETGR